MTAYIIKSGVLLSLFHLFFILFMRRTTFFRFNRVMLLAGSAVCMILTFIYLSGAATILLWIAVSMLKMHVRCLHSLDILLFELITILYWFSPIVWLTRQELRLLHEYEVDEAVIKDGVNAADYQLLLVKKAVGEKRFLLANGFNYTKLKKRITMIQKNRSVKWARLGYAACFPILLAALSLFNPQPVNAQDKNELVTFTMVPAVDKVDVRPTISIQGEELDVERGLARWVTDNLTYTDHMKKVVGTIKVSILIESDGTISPFSRVVEGIDEEADSEVLRLIKAAPKCKPAMKDGKPTMVDFILLYEFVPRIKLTVTKKETETKRLHWILFKRPVRTWR